MELAINNNSWLNSPIWAWASSCLLFSRLLSHAHSWQLVTGQLAALSVLSILMYTPEPSGRQSGDLDEKWRQFGLRNIFIHARKALFPLRRKWCSGFLSSLKIHRPRSGSNPRTLGPASTQTTSPPRSTELAIGRK
jgi:hypothetical protein